MRVRIFKGLTLADVMGEVRRSLGPDAVILSQEKRKGTITVTAAIEATSRETPSKSPAEGHRIARDADLERRLRQDLLGAMKTETLLARSRNQTAHKGAPLPHTEDLDLRTPTADARGDGWVRTGTMGIVTRRIRPPGAISLERPNERPHERAHPERVKGTDAPAPALNPEREAKLTRALLFHGVPQPLADDLLRAAAMMDTDDAPSALACALDARFSLDPIPALPARPLMLVGPPGAGKTVTAAKLAARTVLLGRGIDIISTDALRAGAREQMESFTSILKEDLVCISRPDELSAHLMGEALARARPAIIDTPGTNPFSRSEVDDLRAFAEAGDVEPVLVLPAGGDPAEQTDMAHVFRTLGVHRMIVTRIDAARRFGGVLAAADAAKLSLAQFSMTPYIARGLSTMNPMSLARLLTEHAASQADRPERSTQRHAP